MSAPVCNRGRQYPAASPENKEDSMRKLQSLAAAAALVLALTATALADGEMGTGKTDPPPSGGTTSTTSTAPTSTADATVVLGQVISLVLTLP